MGLDAGFLQMLKSRLSWEAYTGQDTFGNDVYAAPVTIEAFVDNIDQTFGTEDGQSKQDGPTIYTGSLITDYKGIKVKDRITVQSRVMQVSSVTTGNDEFGDPLFQEVTVVTTPRG